MTNVFSEWHKEETCAHLFKKNKSLAQLPRHSSLRFILNFFHFLFFFFFFWNPSYRAYFQPLFLYGLSFTTKFLCDPFHRAHHGNLVRPGKNAPQRTQGHILYKKRGGKASGSFFLSFSFSPPSFPAAPLLAWQKKKKAQDRVCVARKPLLFIDRETRMTEWPTHLH